ncbi:hypothetical protein [Paraburkholderia fungorum]|uniref:hypothetical protein n=1 Tax=Paraburkholderia fungorum TaxID=134537 RepID=UPI002092CDC5|nr:hypothetical protein [Paraburkholderia fungorum]USU17765.1 hypothetical protein NFE55_08415 [Paraburkholderia fungorum]USU25709.1 hypothetical protein NFS19_08415 [Paraburkholderia fungorum]
MRKGADAGVAAASGQLRSMIFLKLERDDKTTLEPVSGARCLCAPWLNHMAVAAEITGNFIFIVRQTSEKGFVREQRNDQSSHTASIRQDALKRDSCVSPDRPTARNGKPIRHCVAVHQTK